MRTSTSPRPGTGRDRSTIASRPGSMHCNARIRASPTLLSIVNKEPRHYPEVKLFFLIVSGANRQKRRWQVEDEDEYRIQIGV
jgi:hypothetical protein